MPNRIIVQACLRQKLQAIKHEAYLLSFPTMTADMIFPLISPSTYNTCPIFSRHFCLALTFGTFPAGKRKSCTFSRTRPSPSGGAHFTARCDLRGRWPGSASRRVMTTSTVVRSAARSVHFFSCHCRPLIWKQACSLFIVILPINVLATLGSARQQNEVCRHADERRTNPEVMECKQSDRRGTVYHQHVHEVECQRTDNTIVCVYHRCVPVVVRSGRGFRIRANRCHRAKNSTRKPRR